MIGLQTIAVAFAMFSALPVPQFAWNQKNMRYAMCAFPLIGVVIGGLWCLCGALPLPMPAKAAGFCLIPVWVTGGIHLDGYADTCDALSSYGDREKKLEILKDPHCGAFAVIRLCSYFAAYLALCACVDFTPRVGLCWTLALVLERALSGLAVASFPMAKNTGLAHTFATAADRVRVRQVLAVDGGYEIVTDNGSFSCKQCIVSVGRSGSKWMESVCQSLDIPTKSNRVDIGVRVELPAEVFAPITDELYESKIVYKTEKYQDKVRTFCMNPRGAVVNENTNGIVTVNGHSYEDPAMHTENTNFALLVSKHFTEPFRDSNGYGESIARLSNMLGGGVMVQRFGDLIRGQRSTPKRIEKGFMTPTLAATPGDLSLVMPKRILDGIIEMLYALDKIAPGTASDDTLLYGVEVKFYNMEVALDKNLETPHKGLFVIGDGSGVTHSLSHASASGVYVARHLAEHE